MKLRESKVALIVVLTIAMASIATVSSAQPVVDGVFNPKEWSGATAYPLTINLPEGGTITGEVYLVNDAKDLYVAVHYQRSTIDAVTATSVQFDSDRDGTFGNSDDYVKIHSPACPSDMFFIDGFLLTSYPCPMGSICAPSDEAFGGTTDGKGAVGRNGVWVTHEMRHSLASGDLYDMRARSNLYLAFGVSLYNAAGAQAHSTGDTNYPVQ